MKIFRHIFSIGITVLALISLNSFAGPSEVQAGCGGPFPPKPAHVWAKTGPAGGQVTLYWEGVPYANRYAVAYGTSSGNYQYGADNIGESSSRSYTVSSLSSGTKYYFRLAAANGCASSPFSEEVLAWAGGGATVTKTITAEGGYSQVKVGGTTMTSFLSATAGPNIGQVTLSWQHKEDVDTYHLVYGTASGNYQYGALNIGKTTQFTVGSLVPGRGYYFAIVPVKGNRALYTSDPVWGVARAPVVEVFQTTETNVMTPISIVPEVDEQVVEEEVNEAPEEGPGEDADEAGDVDQNDEEEDNQYEEENLNVQGVSDEADYELEEENYAVENQGIPVYDEDSEPRYGSPEE